MTRLTTTRIDEQKMKIEERKIIDDIPTRTEMIRSEPISTSKCKNHKLKVKSDPEPPPTDSSDDSSSSSDSRRRRKKIIRKIIRKKRRKHQNMSQTHLRAMTLMTRIHPRTVIIDVDDTHIRNIGKRNRLDYAQI